MTQEAHKVLLRSLSVRPEKCWAGVAVTCTPACEAACHQSNSCTRSAGTPISSSRAFTPSGTK